MKTPAPAPRLVTDREAAEYLGVSRSIVRAWIQGGRIPRVELPSAAGDVPGRMLRIDRADLDALVTRSKNVGAPCR